MLAGDPEAPAAASFPLSRVLGVLAVAAAIVMAIALSVRKIDSPDMGYHLACGEHFLDTHQIVCTNRWYYTELDPQAFADPSTWGPSSWFDTATRTYRFVNMNWLSQVLMAVVMRFGGMIGLSILQIVLFAALLVPIVVTGRRNGAPWAGLGAAVVLVALTMSPRIPLRPETFGYLALAIQWCLLAGPGFGPRRAIAVTLLQVLATNVHSYFLLAIGLAAAMLFAALGERRAAMRSADAAGLADAVKRAKWLAVALVGVIVAPFANPWLAHGAWMPVDTLLYMRRHGIGKSGVPSSGQMHPWAAIRELRPTFDRGLGDLLNEPPNAAYVICLVVAALAAIHAARRRRWGWFVALAAMIYVSAQMIRNTGVFAIVAMPVSAALLADAARELRAKKGGPDPLASAFAAVTIVAALAFTFAIVSNRFYLPRSGHTRFGLGVSRVVLPVSAAEWIDAHAPPGRLWCDYDTSSNLMYLTHPHREVPVTTGTWTFPPQLMVDGFLLELGRASFPKFADKYDVRTVVLSTVWKEPTPLFRSLIGDPEWAIVDVGMSHVIFARRRGAGDDFATRNELDPAAFDLTAYLRRVAREDPVRSAGLDKAAELLLYLAWYEPSLQVCDEAIRANAGDARAWAVKARVDCDRSILKVQEAQQLKEAGKAAEVQAAESEAQAHERDASNAARRALGLDPNARWAAGVLEQTAQIRQVLGEGK
ncbi:MAG: hypothetical protein U0167_10640 [bacterium]